MKFSRKLSALLGDVRHVCTSMSWYGELPGSRPDSHGVQGEAGTRRRRRRPHSAFLEGSSLDRYVAPLRGVIRSFSTSSDIYEARAEHCEEI